MVNSHLPLLAISLQSSIGLGWVGLGVLALVALAFYSYRYTRPPLPRAGRIALALLRAFALVATWLLIVQFAVQWSFERPVKTRIAVLVDGSESMGLQDGAGDRRAQLTEALEATPFDDLADRVDWQWYRFDSQLAPLSEGSVPALDGAVTDMDRALRELATLPDGVPDAVLLYSDGAVNRGQAPASAARDLAVPVFTVAVGDSLPPRDFVLSTIAGTDEGYVGEVQPIDATLRATGMAGETVRVRLLNEKGVQVESKTVTLEGEWSEQTVRFDVTPDQAGINTWQVEVERIAGEVDTTNNRRRTTLRAAERRRSVLLFAGAPNPDAGALARALEGDPDTDVTVLVGGGRRNKPVRGSYRDADNLDTFDAAILLCQQPYSSASLELIQRLAGSSLPMMIVTGSEPDRRVLTLLEQRLGGVRTRPLRDAVPLLPTAPNAIFTPEGEWFESTDSPPPLALPPFETERGVTLADGGPQEDGRTIVSVTSAPRTLSWFADGLYKWDLGRRTEDPSGAQFRALLDRILRYLVTPEEEEQVSLASSRDLISGGETAELQVQVRDEARRPVDSARITAQVEHGGSERTVEFRGLGGGRYRADVAPWGEGRYHVTADVQMDGQTIRRTTEFMVDPFHLERAELRMRPDRLRSIAQATGGEFLLPDEVASLSERLPLEEGVEEIAGTWRPFGLWLTLLLIVGLLAVEWLIRTRTGMV